LTTVPLGDSASQATIFTGVGRERGGMKESRRLSVTEEGEEALRPVVDERGGRREDRWREGERRWKGEDGRSEREKEEEGGRT
jgi:hypothetical protein